MSEQQVRIIPQRREVDAARLAEALLDLVGHLSPEERAHYVAEGERILRGIKGDSKPKGPAA